MKALLSLSTQHRLYATQPVLIHRYKVVETADLLLVRLLQHTYIQLSTKIRKRNTYLEDDYYAFFCNNKWFAFNINDKSLRPK